MNPEVLGSCLLDDKFTGAKKRVVTDEPCRPGKNNEDCIFIVVKSIVLNKTVGVRKDIKTLT